MAFFKSVEKGRNDWFIYVATIFLAVFGYILGQIPMTLVLMLQVEKHDDLNSQNLEEFQSNLDFSALHLSSNIGLMLAICIFLFASIGLYFGVKGLHKRNFLSLVSFSERIDWRRILWSFGFWLLITTVFELFMYYMEPQNYTFVGVSYQFIFLIFIALFLLPIQTSFEELFFRAYILQAIGYFSKNKILALLLSAGLFMLVHLMNPEISEYGLWNMIPYYLIAGLFLGYIVIMDDRLELALGVHAATNFFSAAFISYEGAALQTDTLFKTKEVDPLFLSLIFLGFAIIFSLVASKKYAWPSLKQAFYNFDD